MKKFHITIKNNETGEITHDLDTNAIVAGILDDDGAYAVSITSCNALELLNATGGAEKAIDHLLKGHPELLTLKTIMEKSEDETEETTETTEN